MDLTTEEKRTIARNYLRNVGINESHRIFETYVTVFVSGMIEAESIINTERLNELNLKLAQMNGDL